MPDIKTATEANRQAWNLSADHHRKSPLWPALQKDVQRSGFSCFDPTITAALDQLNLSGKSVVQIGCNNGREVFSLAAFGVTSALGIDQSENFIAQAEELNQRALQKAEFVCADIYNLPADTPKGFDLALITIGVLNWMPDLPRFFAIVADLLGPNGQLLIYETHPVLEMFDPASDDPFSPGISYFRNKPFIEQELITYDGTTPEGGAESHWFIHKTSDIITAILAHFTLTGFAEFPHCNREVDYEIYENRTAQLPLCYTLSAIKA